MYTRNASTGLPSFLIFCIGLMPVHYLAPKASAQPTTTISRAVVEARLKEVQESTDLSEETRNELVSLYREALGFIEAQRANAAISDAFSKAREEAPAEIERLRSENEQANVDSPDVGLGLREDANTLTIEQNVQGEKANQAAAVARLAAISRQLAAEVDRPKLARQRLVEARQLAEELAAEVELPPPPGESPLLTEARRWVLSTRAAALDTEIRMLEEELLSQPIRQQLLEAQSEETSISLVDIEARLRVLEDLLAERRREETAQIIAETELAALGEAGKNDVVRELLERNRDLSAELEFLIDATAQATQEINTATELTKRIREHYQTAQQRMEIAGLNPALGRVLHEQRRDLPSLRDYRRRAEVRQQAIVEAGLRDIHYDAESAELQNPATYLDDLMAGIPISQWDTVREPLEELIAARRTLIRKALDANTTYIRVLGELDFEEQQLHDSASEFNSFLVKRLMWVRSADLIGPESFQAIPREISAFLAPDNWIVAMSALIERFFDAPALGLVLLLCAVLFWRAGAIKKAVRATGAEVGSPVRDSYRATLKALGLSALLVLPWPLIFAVTGWELNRSVYVTDGSRAVGIGLAAVGTFLLFLLSARTLCIDGGIAQAHFRWPANFVKGVRRELNRLLIAFTLPGFVMVVTIEQNLTNIGGELSRLMFIIATVALIIFFVRLLRPRTGLIDSTIERDPGERLSIIWLLLIAGIPVALVAAALAGFLYSATTLMDVVIDTLWLILGLIFVHEMISRWLVVLRQRLIHQARLSEWEAARVAAREAGENAEGEDIPMPADEPMVDVTNLDSDARKLLNMGLLIALLIGIGAIWSPVLPALTILDNVTLWTYHEGPAGAERVVRVTLANLGLVLIILIATIFATRSVPSLLEALLRQQTSIGAGSRLAFATLARYGIVLAGIIFIADSIGFRWSQIQWLVAALGVGIGFGLQEIIANFISGLIILMERPIRVGDVVTIGDVSGRVSRLQIRATTITNWDKQELLVPNKEFITGRVLNWTLSDEVVRVVTTVGVSYGSDMGKAIALVREAADENEYVLDSPKPLITFDEFGDNSLIVTVRCFIDSPAHRREAKSSLNLAINEKLREAGIVVAFPQRDVHLDSTRPLDIRIRNSGEPEDPD